MTAYVVAVVAGTSILAAVISYAVTRRYGWLAALMLPLLALAASIAMLWQNEGMGLSDGMGLAKSAVVFSAPTLIGAAVGILVARLRKG